MSVRPLARILVPLAGSDLDDTVLGRVEELACLSGAQVILLRVVHCHLRDMRPVETERAWAILGAVRTRLLRAGVPVRSVTGYGEIAQVIVEKAAEYDVDVIAMGTRGHGAWRRVLEASVPDSVRHQSRVPVLLIRKGSGTAAA